MSSGPVCLCARSPFRSRVGPTVGGWVEGMLAKLSSYTLVGIDAAPVEVEVDVSAASMPKTVLVGLAEAAVRASTRPASTARWVSSAPVSR